jgi:type I restriction enzyme S subunit
LKAAGEDEFSYIDLSAIDQERKQIAEARSIACSEAPSRARQLVESGDVLVSTVRPNLNGVARVGVGHHGATASTGFCVLRPAAGKLDSGYAFQWVKSPAFVSDMVSKATGASYPAVSDRIVLESKIPLPPLPEQSRIAAILDQADALRAKRREALAQLDSLTQSIFIEMFGDPVVNQAAWEMPPFGSVGTLDRGVSKARPRNAPELLGGPYPLIQTGDVANCDGYIRQHTATYSETGLRQSKLWPTGTLCITIAANIAKTGILTFAACFPDSVVGFNAPQAATVEYVRVWLSFLQKALEDAAPESAQKNINLAILRNLKIPVPPLALQQAFATRIGAVEALKATHRTALAELDALFASLQHRAFAGQL